MPGAAHGEKGHHQHGGHHAQADDQPQLLTDHGKDHIGIGSKDVIQPTEAGPLAGEAAGGGGGHGPGLLKAGAVYILPGVAPGGKTLGDIGLHGHSQKARQPRPGQCQKHRGEGAGAHIGDHQEGDEENQRGAEVPNQGQGHDAHGGKADEAIEVAPAEEPVQGGSAHKNVAGLYQLRGLEGVAGKFQPVSGPQHRVAEDHVYCQQPQGQRRHRQAQRHGAPQAPQPPAAEQKQRHGHQGQ